MQRAICPELFSDVGETTCEPVFYVSAIFVLNYHRRELDVCVCAIDERFIIHKRIERYFSAESGVESINF